jgi:hypothetical protein
MDLEYRPLRSKLHSEYAQLGCERTAERSGGVILYQERRASK